MERCKLATPSAVYRLQFETLSFSDATSIIPYLKSLGFESIYCAPYFGSLMRHGYGITCYDTLNAELGTVDDYIAFSLALKKADMGHIVDFVPNHMAADPHNPWWNDFLRLGKDSEFAEFFDVDGTPKLPLDPKQARCNGTSIVVDSMRLPLAPNTHSDLPTPMVLKQQHYTLTKGQCNYRRFFDIDQLVCLRQENPEVFDKTHALIFDLVRQGAIDGLRIDHPDGLADPIGYFEKLSNIDCPIVIEKILLGNEKLQKSFAVDGTVGYEFLNRLTGLFVESDHELLMTSIYENYSQMKIHPHELLFEEKKAFLLSRLSTELDRLEKETGSNRKALIALLAAFPVYRTYLHPNRQVSKQDQEIVDKAFALAQLRAPDVDFSQLRVLFYQCHPGVLRFQQLSAALMAKGQEDTFFYVYNRLLCLNEVGGNPMQFGTSIIEFHNHNMDRLKNWPNSFISTDTHDTKRSEDVRMRIAAISELPKEWEAFLTSMPKAPDPNFGYHLYQTLLGVYDPNDHLEKRLIDYAIKAVREAQVHTSWHAINIDYERSIITFVKEVLAQTTFFDFWKKIDHLGRLNSISALILKIGAPGIFEHYQGSEHWRYHLVDPDNRQAPCLDQVSDKLKIVQTGLQFRHVHKELFLKGEYIPFETTSGRLIAYGRSYHRQKVLIAAARFFASSEPLGEILLPDEWQGPWTDVVTKITHQSIDMNALQPAALLYK